MCGLKELATVEVMDIQTHQWSRVRDLPQVIIDSPTAAICNNHIYISNDLVVMKCFIPNLLKTCNPPMHMAAVLKTSPLATEEVWSNYHGAVQRSLM